MGCWERKVNMGRFVHGWLFLARGSLQEAIDQMRSTRWSLWNEYALACALERQGKVDQAIGGLEQMRLPSDILQAWTGRKAG